MSPKPPLLSGKEIVRAFERIGYYRTSQRGSHIKIRNDSKETTLIIPAHKEVDRWTLKGILKDAEMKTQMMRQQEMQQQQQMQEQQIQAKQQEEQMKLQFEAGNQA